VLTEAVIRIAPGLASLEAAAGRARRIPLVRAGNYDDCAGAAVFLASSMASYITGITVNVDGGTWASSGWARDDDGGWRLYS
jgi:NAD(P)-dependent dehydrogenase (short-subunit alcohol dehydrogenase family)